MISLCIVSKLKKDNDLVGSFFLLRSNFYLDDGGFDGKTSST